MSRFGGYEWDESLVEIYDAFYDFRKDMSLQNDNVIVLQSENVTLLPVELPFEKERIIVHLLQKK